MSSENELYQELLSIRQKLEEATREELEAEREKMDAIRQKLQDDSLNRRQLASVELLQFMWDSGLVKLMEQEAARLWDSWFGRGRVIKQYSVSQVPTELMLKISDKLISREFDPFPKDFAKLPTEQAVQNTQAILLVYYKTAVERYIHDIAKRGGKYGHEASLDEHTLSPMADNLSPSDSSSDLDLKQMIFEQLKKKGYGTEDDILRANQLLDNHESGHGNWEETACLALIHLRRIEALLGDEDKQIKETLKLMENAADRSLPIDDDKAQLQERTRRTLLEAYLAGRGKGSRQLTALVCKSLLIREGKANSIEEVESQVKAEEVQLRKLSNQIAIIMQDRDLGLLDD